MVETSPFLDSYRSWNLEIKFWARSNLRFPRTIPSVSMACGELVRADSHVSGHRIRPKRNWTICFWQSFFMIVSIIRALVEDNTASERIPTVAAMYNCKILEPYKYDANCVWIQYVLRMTPEAYQFMQHKRQLFIIGLMYFWISLNSICLEIKIITKNMFL